MSAYDLIIGIVVGAIVAVAAVYSLREYFAITIDRAMVKERRELQAEVKRLREFMVKHVGS